jgi:hypothetical protein
VVVVVDEGGETTRRGGCDKKNRERTEMWVIEELRLLAIRGLALVEADWDLPRVPASPQSVCFSLPYSCPSASTLRGALGVEI